MTTGPLESPETLARLQKIKLLILDVDGVMTDGRIVHANHGDELKFFDVHDGFGLVLLKRAGIPCVIVTAKKSKLNARRAKEVMAVKIYQNAHDKLKIYEKIKKKFKKSDDEVCFIGDDLIDLPVLSRVGLAVAVQNAVPEVKAKAHWVTAKAGGRGAIREIVDGLLKSQGLWSQTTERYFR